MVLSSVDQSQLIGTRLEITFYSRRGGNIYEEREGVIMNGITLGFISIFMTFSGYVNNVEASLMCSYHNIYYDYFEM